MGKATFQMILQLIEPHAAPTTAATLRYTWKTIADNASLPGIWQHATVGDVVRVSQPTVCRVLRKVCDALLMHFDTFIKMPETNAAREQAAADFRALSEPLIGLTLKYSRQAAHWYMKMGVLCIDII